MPGAKSSSRRAYVLDADAIAELRAVLAADPAKLKRLEERLVHDAEQAARRTALEKKIALLKSRNAALRAAAQPPPQQQQEPLPPLMVALADAADGDDTSITSSTSAGRTLSPQASTMARIAAAGVPTRGPSPATPEAHVMLNAKASGAAASPRSSTKPTNATAGVDEFDEATISSDAAAVPDTWGTHKSVFRYGGPSVKGMVSSVVKEGVLYRIITDKGEWAFYCDSRFYTATVRYRLLGGSAVTPGPSVTVTPAGPDQELRLELGPEETKVLLKGRVVDFENLSSVALLPRRPATSAEEQLLCREPLTDWKVITASYPRASSAGAKGSITQGAAVERSLIPVEGLLEHCMTQHIRFVDPSFFPGHAALFRHDMDEYFVPPLHWRSVFKYLPDDEKVRREVRLFRGPALNPDGLRGGPLFPDDTFLSCVVGLASRCPEQLRSLFLHPSGALEGRRERAVGAYRVSLCLGGWWECVVVDGFVPASSTCPEFSHSADDLRLLWLPLLQKAYAKLWGSYAASLNAPLESLLSLLTGGPCCTLRELWPSRDDLRGNTARAARFFATLKTVLRTPSQSSPGGPGLGYVCWLRPYSLSTARAQTTRDKLERLYGDVGLIPGTATVVLGIETLLDGHCVVCLRQTVEQHRPTEAWLAVWRAARKPWVEEVTDLVFALGDAEGKVWMGLEDVPQYFQSGYLTPLTGDWAAVRARGRFDVRRPSLALQVDVTVPTRVVVTVTQADMDALGRPKLPSTASTPTSTSTPVQRTGETIKTEGVLAGLCCLGFGAAAAGGTANLRCLGCSCDSADIFETAATPRFTYERDVSLGVVLDPSNGPFFFLPACHTSSLDVAYTMTVQAVGVAAAAGQRVGTASPAAAAMTVRFLEVVGDGVTFQAGVHPVVRSTSLVPRSTPLVHQARPLGRRRVVSGGGSSVTLSL